MKPRPVSFMLMLSLPGLEHMRGPVVGSKQVLKQTASCLGVRDEPDMLPHDRPLRMDQRLAGFGVVRGDVLWTGQV